MGKKKQGSPEDTVDKAVGRVLEATGSISGDATMEAEGRALGKTGQRTTSRVVPQPEGGWIVEEVKAGQVTSVHRTKDEAVKCASELAKANESSQVLVYKKDGTVQAEHTYG